MHSNFPKVGYVMKRYPRFSETFIVNEILAHEAAGYPVGIFALRPDEETHFQDILGRVKAPVVRIPDKIKNTEEFWQLLNSARARLPKAWDALATMDGAAGNDVAQAVLLALACKKQGIGHLHAHFGTVATTVARLAARLAGIGYSFTAHAKDIYFDYEESIDLDVKLRDATHVVTVSDYNLRYLRHRFRGDASRVTRLYNGLDLDRFAFHEQDNPDGAILAVGRLVEKKGFHILIEAIRVMREEGRAVRCRIVGGGEEAANLSAQVAASGLQDAVELMGPRPQAEVMAMMREAAVFACPCVVGRNGNRDGLPTVLLEAMALGTAVVATDVTGIPELVRDGQTGLCVAEGDPVALAQGLSRLMDDANLRRRLAKAGREAIERDFDIRINAARLRNMFAKQTVERPEPAREIA